MEDSTLVDNSQLLNDYEIELLMEEANCDENGNVDYIKLSEKIFGEKYTK